MVTVGGMAKGSGMIHPNMATMLGYLTTDAAIGQRAFKRRSDRRSINHSIASRSTEMHQHERHGALPGQRHGRQPPYHTSSADFTLLRDAKRYVRARAENLLGWRRCDERSYGWK